MATCERFCPCHDASAVPPCCSEPQLRTRVDSSVIGKGVVPWNDAIAVTWGQLAAVRSFVVGCGGRTTRGLPLVRAEPVWVLSEAQRSPRCSIAGNGRHQTCVKCESALV